MNYCQVCKREKSKVYKLVINIDNIQACGVCIGAVRDTIADIKYNRLVPK